MSKTPQTAAGRALRDDHSEHPNGTWPDDEMVEAILNIEDESRREFLDEMIAVGAISTPMSFDEIKAATDSLMKQASRIDEEKLARALKATGRVIVPQGYSTFAIGVSDGVHEVLAAYEATAIAKALRA
jgi:hypothetical protein